MAEQVAVTKVIEIDVKASAEANAHLQQIAAGMQGIEKSAMTLGNAFQQVSSMVKGFVGFQIFDAVGGTILKVASALQEASDKSKVLEERMKLVSGSTEGAQTAFQAIIDISIRQGRELDSTAKLYEKVARNSDQLALSQKGVALITEGVAASLRLAGAGTQEANAAMLQFAQALASGKLGGDEFRSLMENDSILMQAFAKELHTTMGGLREMAKDGKLSAETLREAMLRLGPDGQNMLQRIIAEADKLPKTFAQAVDGAKTSLVDLINALQQTGDKTEGIFTKVIKALTEHIREAAAMTRFQAGLAEEVAKATGKELTPADLPKAPLESRMTEMIIQSQKTDRALLQQAQAQLAKAPGGSGGLEGILAGRERERLQNAVNAIQGRLNYYDQQLAKFAMQDEQATLRNEFVSGGKVTTTPDTKKKAKGPDTAVDVIADIKAQLAGETAELNALIEGQSKAAAKLEETLLRIDRVKPGGLTAQQIADFKTYARNIEVENNARRDLIEKIKEQTAAEDFMQKAAQASDERVRAKFENDLKSALAAAAKDRKEDPMATANILIGQLEELRANKDINPEESDALADYIIRLRDEAYMKVQKAKPRSPFDDMRLTMQDSWKRSFDTMTEDLLDFSKSAKDIVGDMVLSILKDFARIQLQEKLDPLFKAGGRYLDEAITNWFSPSAMGNVFNKGIKFFANGDVLNGPTPFTYNGGRSLGVGGEAGPEAVVPLNRGADGKLGLGATPVTVNVFNNGSNTKATTSESVGSNGQREIRVLIEDVVEQSLGSGRQDGVLNKAFGLNRRGN